MKKIMMTKEELNELLREEYRKGIADGVNDYKVYLKKFIDEEFKYTIEEKLPHKVAEELTDYLEENLYGTK